MVVRREDIRECIVHGKHYRDAVEHARKAEIGGTSWVRGKGDRKRNLVEDQLVGMMGLAAGSLVLFESWEPFLRSREKANADPYKGDGGEDLPGNIDMKATKRRTKLRLSRYSLPVRPRERHKGVRYVYVLVDLGRESALMRLFGWAWEHELPDEPESNPRHPLCGAFLIPVPELHPVDELKEQLI